MILLQEMLDISCKSFDLSYPIKIDVCCLVRLNTIYKLVAERVDLDNQILPSLFWLLSMKDQQTQKKYQEFLSLRL